MANDVNEGTCRCDGDYVCVKHAPSTTWGRKVAKISRAPQASANSRPKGGRSYFRRLDKANWRRKPIALTITYRGGAECWFEIHARGGLLRVTGDTALFDVIKVIANTDT